MQIDVVVAFFVLGMLSTLVNSKIDFPKGLYQTLTLFLLLAIGLKGGVALDKYASLNLIPQTLLVICLGVAIPFIAYPVLKKVGGWSRNDAASTAAHYGSVSVATFAVAVSVLEAQGTFYEPYFPLFVVSLEIPAIAVGIWLAKRHSKVDNRKQLCHELFLNQGVVLLVGGLLIGWWGGSRTDNIMPFFSGMFHGVLALFLLQMGRVAAGQIGTLRQQGLFLTSFAIAMPLAGAVLGGLIAWGLDFSAGGITLLATLGASASYIAVPAAMSVALPEANLSLPLSGSLAITFPFNVLVGIPAYLAIAHQLT
ncbi:sodium-dependent bicarbonate transport family permease [Porticoccaceae bacterium LTM1]|nr:sodium-dependent bicarbonate transport family permease [Porticoccaceae bacterium LTM1]